MVGHHRWDMYNPEEREEGPDGLFLKLSKANPTGYLNVKRIGNKYYVKIAQTYPKPQRTLPGPSFATAREAAIRYAFFWAANGGCGRRASFAEGEAAAWRGQGACCPMPLMPLLTTRVVSCVCRSLRRD